MKRFLSVFFIALLFFGLGIGYYYYNSLKPSKVVLPMSEELYLIVEDNIIDRGKPIIYKDGNLYFTFDFLQEYIDENLFYDKDEETIIFTNENFVKRFKIDDLVGIINHKEFFIDNPLIKFENKVFIPYDIFKNDYDISVNYYEDTNAVVIDFLDTSYLTGNIILQDGKIRTNMDIKSPIIEKDLDLGDQVYVYGEYENWLKVRTYDGILGFIQKKYIKLNHTKDIYKNQLIDRDIVKGERREKINLTWDYTYAKVKFTDNIKPIPGVNVISPTWFSILDNTGKIQDKGNKDYVIKYNDLGYELWPLIDNSFDPDLTSELLNSSAMREKIILDIKNIYMDYGFQGINIDFENVHLKDKDLLTQFVRELYPIFRENNMVVSMDVTTISTSENWSLSFDRPRLHKALDYIFLMAYDQHWASSPLAGSVAEYKWVERGLIKVLEQIPHEKLVLGIPFYTRLWIEENEKLSSKSISMEVANNFISENSIQTVWNELAGQYYGELIKDNKDYKIWLEDEKSLGYKVSLVHKYNLAGIGSWRKGFETGNIWGSLDKNLN